MTSSGPRRLLAAALLALASLAGAEARAQPAPPSGAESAAQVAAGRALAEQAEQLAGEGRLVAAIAKFEASFAADPKSRALFGRAECHERLGATASAWGDFRRAAERASAEGDAARAAEATRRAAALEPRLVRVKVEAGAAGAPTVTLDDRPLAPTFWGVPLPVDPGRHEIVARAPGREPFSAPIELRAEGETRVVVIPELRAPPPPTRRPVPPSAPSRAELPPDPPARSSSAAEVVGAVLLVTGAVAAVPGYIAVLVLVNQRNPADSALIPALSTALGGTLLGAAGWVVLKTAPRKVAGGGPRLELLPRLARDEVGASLRLVW